VRIAALESAIASVPGAIVLDRTRDADHNRSVITFAGSPQAVLEAALRAAAQALESIDLTCHQGVHPRLGALDVLPFVPLAGAALEDCAQLAHRAGERIWSELRIPVYFYEAAARRPAYRKLEDVRRGQFEGVRDAVLVDETRAPDLGGPALHPTAGAVIVGARKVLIAFNINLATSDIEIAKDIARRIRESSGGLPCVKALGLRLASRGLVQVSMNLTDFEQTPIDAVFDLVSRLAAAHRVTVLESELIGLLPRQAVEAAFARFVKLPDFHSGRVIENRIEMLRSKI
jgi:glutamate formiminotransferase